MHVCMMSTTRPFRVKDTRSTGPKMEREWTNKREDGSADV